jgi:hypothetical protein
MIKEVTEMKKIMLLATMVLAATFGTAYAYHGSGVWATGESGHQPKNGITVFCNGPTSFDSVPAARSPKNTSYYEESSATGGFRGEEFAAEPFNGVTVFSYGPVTFDMVPLEAGAMSSSYFEESAAAGGLRAGEGSKELYNGITDFTGRSYEMINAGAEGTAR